MSVYWEYRYKHGGDSGCGSRGEFAIHKAEVINRLIDQHMILSMIDLGCGDGYQASMLRCSRYLGFDVSESAVALCRETCVSDSTKSFRLVHEYAGERVDLTLSMDVILHLVEEEAFDVHMQLLFGAAERLVVIYSSNHIVPGRQPPHVRYRVFTGWIEVHAPMWTLDTRVSSRNKDAGSLADFWVFRSLQ